VPDRVIEEGDTLTMLDASNVQYKMRFSAIDAPERDQRYGAASKTQLSKRAAGKVAEALCYKKDRYKRHICIVYVDGKDVALAQTDAGLAREYLRYLNELSPSRQDEYLPAEARAAADRVGLWRDNSPIPPWEWRRR
jgi:endonuclease YncB( thermonuclease family)